MGELENDDSSRDAGSDSGGCGTVSTSEFRKSVLSSAIMLNAYAISVVVLSVGLVILAVTIAVLSFFYPNQANTWIGLIGCPLATLVVLHFRDAKQHITNANKLLVTKSADNK